MLTISDLTASKFKWELGCAWHCRATQMIASRKGVLIVLHSDSTLKFPLQ